MSNRKPQLHKIFSLQAPSQSITAFMLPVFEDPVDVDGEEGVVKPGVVQCIAQHHPDRRDGKLPTDPFFVLCPQGLQNFEDHLRIHHGASFNRNKDQLTIGSAFASVKKKARTDDAVTIGTRVFMKMICTDNEAFVAVEREGF
jgi:hypothetical protein